MEIYSAKAKIDFMGKRHISLVVSLVFIGLALYAFVVKGLQFGIDFSGGTEIHVKFEEATTSAEVRKLLATKGFTDTVVQHFGQEGSNDFLLRLKVSKEQKSTVKSISDNITDLFVQSKGQGKFEIKKVDMVGPKVGSDLKKRGAWALFYALIGILLYVALRFDVRFSPGSVIALIHDVVITLGIFALASKKFDLTTLAAALTIIGYSVNDTIVVFDRIRENMKVLEGLSIVEIINRSINETLSRTLLTSITTLVVVFSLFQFGGNVIHDFAFTLLIGVIVGTYSSIFVASPIFLAMYNRAEKSKS